MTDKKERDRVKRIVKDFETVCIDLATGNRRVEYKEWEKERDRIINEPDLRMVLPDWIMEKRYGSQFWQFIKSLSPNYAGRREFIWNSINEIHNFLDSGASSPISISIQEMNTSVKNQTIDKLWKKIHSRIENDPEGAITASRTLLETTLKYILDERNIKYASKEEITSLYQKVSKTLNLSPANHAEQMFKQILQGITSVVHGFSSIRNEFGDAHGKGKGYLEPERRHADLVANLSGTMCVFLIETHNFKKK